MQLTVIKYHSGYKLIKNVHYTCKEINY